MTQLWLFLSLPFWDLIFNLECQISEYHETTLIAGFNSSSSHLQPCSYSTYVFWLSIGLTYHGKAADTWAVGVTLYCMVLGQYPFLGDTLQDTYDKVWGSQYSFWTKTTKFLLLYASVPLFNCIDHVVSYWLFNCSADC